MYGFSTKVFFFLLKSKFYEFISLRPFDGMTPAGVIRDPLVHLSSVLCKKKKKKKKKKKTSRKHAYIILTPLNPTFISKTGVYRGIH